MYLCIVMSDHMYMYIHMYKYVCTYKVPSLNIYFNLYMVDTWNNGSHVHTYVGLVVVVGRVGYFFVGESLKNMFLLIMKVSEV